LIDLFYDTVGVHALALTALAYSRGLLLNFLEPRGGYTTVMTPTHRAMGLNWLLIYTSIAYFIFMIVYFTAEIFTFVYIGQILLKTIISFLLSMFVVMGYHLLFNPRS
jgi:L-asparagine transporter-like permease